MKPKRKFLALHTKQKRGLLRNKCYLKQPRPFHPKRIQVSKWSRILEGTCSPEVLQCILRNLSVREMANIKYNVYKKKIFLFLNEFFLLTIKMIPPTTIRRNAKLNKKSKIFSNLNPSPEVHLSTTAHVPMPINRAIHKWKRLTRFVYPLKFKSLLLPPDIQKRKLKKNIVYFTHDDI